MSLCSAFRPQFVHKICAFRAFCVTNSPPLHTSSSSQAPCRNSCILLVLAIYPIIFHTFADANHQRRIWTRISSVARKSFKCSKTSNRRGKPSSWLSMAEGVWARPIWVCHYCRRGQKDEKPHGSLCPWSEDTSRHSPYLDYPIRTFQERICSQHQLSDNNGRLVYLKNRVLFRHHLKRGWMLTTSAERHG